MSNPDAPAAPPPPPAARTGTKPEDMFAEIQAMALEAHARGLKAYRAKHDITVSADVASAEPSVVDNDDAMDGGAAAASGSTAAPAEIPPIDVSLTRLLDDPSADPRDDRLAMRLEAKVDPMKNEPPYTTDMTIATEMYFAIADTMSAEDAAAAPLLPDGLVVRFDMPMTREPQQYAETVAGCIAAYRAEMGGGAAAARVMADAAGVSNPYGGITLGDLYDGPDAAAGTADDAATLAAATTATAPLAPPPPPPAGAATSGGAFDATAASTGVAPLFLERDAGRNILQLRVYKQFHPSNCGFHSMYNALCVLKACRARTADEARDHIRAASDGVGFWTTFARLHRQLRRHGPTSKSWEDKAIREALLNDFYAPYLISNDTALRAAGGASRVYALPGFDLLPNGEVRRVHRAFQEIARARNISVAFLLGSSKHWVMTVVNKVRGKLELIFCDSANKEIVRTTDEAVALGKARVLVEQARDRSNAWHRKHHKFAHLSDEAINALYDNGEPVSYIPQAYWPIWPLEERVNRILREFQATMRFLDVIRTCSAGESTMCTMFLEHKVSWWLKSFHDVSVRDGRLVVTRQPARRYYKRPSAATAAVDGGTAGDADDAAAGAGPSAPAAAATTGRGSSGAGSAATVVDAHDEAALGHVGIEEWVSNMTRPASVQTGLVNVIRDIGPHYLSRDSLHRLGAWVRDVSLAIASTEPATLGRSTSTASAGGTPLVTKLHWVFLGLERLIAPYCDDPELMEAHALLMPASPHGSRSTSGSGELDDIAS